MSIEPLLMRLRNEPLFKVLLYHWIAQLNYQRTLMMLMYMSLKSSDINTINRILSTYQSVSNAKVNWTKSWGLKMNDWDVVLSCKLGISWNTKELLGVFLWGDDAIAKNWTFVEENVDSVIKSWTFF